MLGCPDGELVVEDVLALGLDALDLDGVELGIVVVRKVKVGDGVVGAGKLSLNVAGLVELRIALELVCLMISLVVR